jgi:hypothetical protein
MLWVFAGIAAVCGCLIAGCYVCHAGRSQSWCVLQALHSAQVHARYYDTPLVRGIIASKWEVFGRAQLRREFIKFATAFVMFVAYMVRASGTSTLLCSRTRWMVPDRLEAGRDLRCVVLRAAAAGRVDMRLAHPRADLAALVGRVPGPGSGGADHGLDDLELASGHHLEAQVRTKPTARGTRCCC